MQRSRRDIDSERDYFEIELLDGTIDVAAVEVDRKWKARLDRHVRRGQRRLGQRIESFGAGWDTAADVAGLAENLVPGHGFDSLDTGLVDGKRWIAEGGHDLMDCRSHSHDLEELAVVDDRRGWVAERWVERKDRQEVDGQLEKAVANALLGLPEEK